MITIIVVLLNITIIIVSLIIVNRLNFYYPVRLILVFLYVTRLFIQSTCTGKEMHFETSRDGMKKRFILFTTCVKRF